MLHSKMESMESEEQYFQFRLLHLDVIFLISQAAQCHWLSSPLLFTDIHWDPKAVRAHMPLRKEWVVYFLCGWMSIIVESAAAPGIILKDAGHGGSGDPKRGRILQWRWVILHELGRGGLWDQKWGWTVISAQSNFAFNLKTCCNLINLFVFYTQSIQTVISGRLLQPSSLKNEIMPTGTPTSLSVLVTLVTALMNILKKGPWTATVPGHTAGNKLV